MGRGNLIYYIEQDEVAFAQADWFCRPDLGRFDANKPAYRGVSLLCFEFMFEAAFWARDGAQRRLKASSLSWLKMQKGNRIWSLWKRAWRDANLAVDEAKVRLNFAVCPGAWLMPAAQMVINKESTLGYNNQLSQAIKFEWSSGLTTKLIRAKNSRSTAEWRKLIIIPPKPIHKAKEKGQQNSICLRSERPVQVLAANMVSLFWRCSSASCSRSSFNV